MPGPSKFKMHVCQALLNCSEKTEEINRCIIGMLATLISRYPRNVDVRGIINTNPHQELTIRIIEILVQDGLLSGIPDRINLTLAGYSAINDAMRAEPRLAVALREEGYPQRPYDYTALMLSILRAYSARRQRN